MPPTGAAKTARTKITNVEVLLKQSGSKNYLITYGGRDAGMFTPLNTEIFPNCVAEVRNALKAWHNRG